MLDAVNSSLHYKPETRHLRKSDRSLENPKKPSRLLGDLPLVSCSGQTTTEDVNKLVTLHLPDDTRLLGRRAHTMLYGCPASSYDITLGPASVLVVPSCSLGPAASTGRLNSSRMS